VKVEARILPSSPSQDGLKWAAIATALALILLAVLVLILRSREVYSALLHAV
jgi:hypothetical protein